jgi:hypothetical protein
MPTTIHYRQGNMRKILERLGVVGDGSCDTLCCGVNNTCCPDVTIPSTLNCVVTPVNACTQFSGVTGFGSVFTLTYSSGPPGNWAGQFAGDPNGCGPGISTHGNVILECTADNPSGSPPGCLSSQFFVAVFIVCRPPFEFIFCLGKGCQTSGSCSPFDFEFDVIMNDPTSGGLCGSSPYCDLNVHIYA